MTHIILDSKIVIKRCNRFIAVNEKFLNDKNIWTIMRKKKYNSSTIYSRDITRAIKLKNMAEMVDTIAISIEDFRLIDVL